MLMKRQQPYLIALLLIVALAGFFHWGKLKEFPKYTHAWAQADRYALAQGFVNNGLDFFHPETFVYNKQFPNNFKSPSATTITAVDFPLPDYCVALLMKLLDIKDPWIFRCFTLLYSFLGLFFLFKLARAYTQDDSKSYLLLIFAALSPVFVYYQAGFLPSISALSNSFIGLYFYHKYLGDKSGKSLATALFFITLATLSRTTFALCLCAIMAWEFLKISQSRSNFKTLLLPCLFSVSTVLGYLLYNIHLRTAYGSLFLNELKPSSSMDQLQEIMLRTYQNWGFHYFSLPQYLVILVVLGCGIYFALKKGFIDKNWDLLGISTLMLLASTAFFLVMAQQFPAHDYYFLDSFFLPLILLLLVALKSIPPNLPRFIKVTLPLLFLFLGGYAANKTQDEKRITGPWDRIGSTIEAYSGSDKILDSLGYTDDIKVLVLDANAPNIPFILMQRKGYAVMNTSRSTIAHALSWDYDLIATQNDYFLTDIYAYYPEIIQQSEKVYDNGRISFSRSKKQEKEVKLEEYLGFKKDDAILYQQMNFDSTESTGWSNLHRSDELVFSAPSASRIRPTTAFGLTYAEKAPAALSARNTSLFISGMFQIIEAGKLELVVSIKEEGKHIYYESRDLSSLMGEVGEWKKIVLIFSLPRLASEDCEFALYLWNTGNADVALDDFSFAVY